MLDERYQPRGSRGVDVGIEKFGLVMVTSSKPA
jgi:hypothetical protein